MHQNIITTSAQADFNAEAFTDNMKLLSLKDSTKTSNGSQNRQLPAQGNISKSSAGKWSHCFWEDHVC